ncbi:MAG TPA: hypothetical protein PLM80_03905 [Mesotoga sp.]|jgi:NADH:ubiquinone oxidoreductase subunit K|nr:hypothetical protein [Mesotoga sp.]MDD4041393.1 hypothetical protein [Mesotoga sp.]MDD4478335.1 hypothetical protein [Mesotoga sp.]MDD5745154.1 hypothetical protein [Mesotoga sp.]HOY25282.1 hypothetical protein [Mesotoga sp.]
MLYRIIFSLIPLFLMPIMGHGLLRGLLVSSVMVAGVLLGRESHRVSRIQNLTFVLFYALLIFGYLQNTSAPLYGDQIFLLAVAQGVSGLYGLFHRRKTLSILFACGCWTLIAVSLAQVAYAKLGTKGILLAGALMVLVALQDVRRILKPIDRNYTGRDGME